MKQSSVSVLFSLVVLLVVAYPSPAQGSVARNEGDAGRPRSAFRR